MGGNGDTVGEGFAMKIQIDPLMYFMGSGRC